MKVETMSINNDDSTDDAREAEIVLDSGETKLRGDVFKDAAGNLLLKLIGKQIDSSKELPGVPPKNRDSATVWVQITDKDDASHRLLQRGQSLLAWVRFKQNDGSFITKKTVLFSLGTVAAVTITRQVIRHYKSR